MRVLRVVLLSVVGLLAVWGGVEADVGLESHAPIVILSDAGFTVDNGVRGGGGTVDDPYIISGWRIDAEQGDPCIRVENVNGAFRIVDCALFGANEYAARLVDVAHAELVGCCISSSLFGVLCESCRQCHVRDCSFDEIGWGALALVGSSGCRVSGCLFVEGSPAIGLRERSTGNKLIGNVFLAECGTAIRLDPQCGGNLIARNDFRTGWCYSDSYNRWNDLEGNGNHWSRYRGKDRDGDGVGDTHVCMLGGAYEVDQHPSIAPYYPEAETEWYLCEPRE